jgi:hypothetical protein
MFQKPLPSGGTVRRRGWHLPGRCRVPTTMMLGFPETWSSLRVAAIHEEVDGVVEELDRVLVWRGGSA